MNLLNKLTSKIKKIVEKMRWYPEELFPKKAYAPVVRPGQFYPPRRRNYR